MPKIKNLQDLLAKFTDEETCRQYLVDQRWNGSPICPHCSAGKYYKIEGGKRFKCAQCLKKFSVTVGTIFEDSKIPLRTWFAALYLISAHRKGISSLQLSRDLGVTQKTAWFMLHRIREGLREKDPALLVNEVQVDETYIGGRESNMHKEKRSTTQGNRQNTKTAVVGMLQKDGNVIAEVVPWVTRRSLEKLIIKNIDKPAILVTDSCASYYRVGKQYQHVIVNHSAGQYKVNSFHTNGIENYWSLLKRGIVGIYHQVSPKHLHRYCHEFSYRYNSRKIPDNERFEISLSHLNGRLKYADLING